MNSSKNSSGTLTDPLFENPLGEVTEEGEIPPGRGTDSRGQQRFPAGAARNAWAAAGDACYWFIPALAALYAKYVTLVPARGLEIVRRATSPGWSSSGAGIGQWQAVSFYRMDLLVGFFLVPAAYFLVAVFLPRRWSSRIAWTSSTTLALMIYIQVRALETSGSYISLHTLRVAASWGLREPLANAAFLGWGSAALLGALAVSSPLIAGVLQRWIGGSRGTALPPETERGGKNFAIAGALLLSAVTVFAWTRPIPVTVFHRSAMIVALRAYANAGLEEGGQSRAFAREMAGLTIPQLEARYRKLANAPAMTRDAAFWAKAQGYNVVFFILETTPTRFLSVTGDLSAFPHLQQLREHSFVPARHYTTFPVTHRALYSLFGSLYPSPEDLSLPEKKAQVALPGMFRALAASGYQTSAYMPFQWSGEYDDQMFEMLGVTRRVYPDASTYSSVIGSSNAGENWREARFEHDRAALALLENDLTGWLSQQTKFAAVFLPQIGHVPLPLPGDEVPHSESEVLSREKIILQTEDEWLGALMQLLQSHNALEHTLIVVTGDHGIRVANEDPAFTPGMVDADSFQVPFLLYAPGVLQRTQWIPWVTSHIDVPPTVLDLLGIDGRRELMEGNPLWSADLAQRTTYFFAARLFGADGYYRNQEFFMSSKRSGFAYASPQLHFDMLDPLPQYSGRSQNVEDSINRMSALQQALEHKLAGAYPPR